MASPSGNEVQESTASRATQNLRALAQSHLSTIEAEDSELALKETAAARALERYAKVRRKERQQQKAKHTSSSLSPSPPPALVPDTKGARLRSAQDVLDRLRHDPTMNVMEYRVGYLERFEGIKEMPVTSWISESTDEEWIPQHRIKYVKRVDGSGKEEVVWDRDARVDKVFGSGGKTTPSAQAREETGQRREEELESEYSYAGGVTL